MINLVMALHCHQPVGNFGKVFNMAHEKCYRPLLELLEAHPRVRCGVHFSGPLFEWMDDHRPETLDLMKVLIARNQVEPMSGGFYEPLLATIPARDARGQIHMMNDYLDERFGRRPTGFWLTERIWDPGLPETIAGTDMKYTVVDDTHFYYAGLGEDDIFGSYVTERHGHRLNILATPMIMRYLIPFKLVPDVIEHLRNWDQEGRRVAVYGDDGEKFGLWPGTHEWVIEKGWLNDFFTALEDNGDWLKTTPPGEYVADHDALGRIYMPQASYEEMTEWALPMELSRFMAEIIETLKNENRWDEWRPFVRGGVWDNFLVKYDESNRMHKKMLFLSELAGDMEDMVRTTAGGDSAISTEYREVRKLVWRAQCNCAYWHGVFGGLYMGHLRRAIYENLILAQSRLVEMTENEMSISIVDYNQDGREEVVIQGPSVSLVVEPGRGGCVSEWCHMGKALNLADNLTRRPEAYHHKLKDAVYRAEWEEVASIHDLLKAKEPDLERFLVYDTHTRLSLIDHFLEREVPPEDLAAGRYHEVGNFVEAPYDLLGTEKHPDRVRLDLAMNGRVWDASVRLRKTIRAFQTPMVQTHVDIEHSEDYTLETLYGCEFNLTVFSDQDDSRYYLAPEHGRRREVYETGAEYHVTRFDLINGADGLRTSLHFSRQAIVSFFPLMTVSMSEDGFEKVYQGTTLYVLFPLRLEPGKKEGLEIRMDLADA